MSAQINSRTDTSCELVVSGTTLTSDNIYHVTTTCNGVSSNHLCLTYNILFANILSNVEYNVSIQEQTRVGVNVGSSLIVTIPTKAHYDAFI